MKTIKKTKRILFLVLGIFALVLGCSEDDTPSVDSTPEFQTFVEAISSLPGETLTFEGVAVDPAGIETINIKYEPWFLDKTIVKDSLPNAYELAYSFKVPEDATENSSHDIPITITNAGGIAITRSVLVTLDQDIINPSVEIVAPINGATVLIGNGDEINFNVNVTDASLQEFSIESTVLNETIAITGTSFNYTKALDITEAGSYTFTISATDTTGNMQTETVTVNVLTELLFDVMYITDVTDAALLSSDLFGIPYSTEASEVQSEDGYVFNARYYSPAPNSEVRFLPQKTSFQPYTFGSNPEAPGELVLGSGSDVDPIILPEMGYYEIRMDLRNQTYTVTPYNPSDTAFDQVYILGRGIFIDATTSTCTNNADGSTQCWNFRSGKPFTQDANNVYLWTIDVTVQDQPDDEGANGFILNANPAGWSPFWRVDNPEDPEATVFNGGSNYVFPEEALGSDYRFTFDTHLNRIIAVKR